SRLLMLNCPTAYFPSRALLSISFAETNIPFTSLSMYMIVIYLTISFPLKIPQLFPKVKQKPSNIQNSLYHVFHAIHIALQVVTNGSCTDLFHRFGHRNRRQTA